MAAIVVADSEVEEATPRVSKDQDVAITAVEAETEAVRLRKLADVAQEVEIADQDSLQTAETWCTNHVA